MGIRTKTRLDLIRFQSRSQICSSEVADSRSNGGLAFSDGSLFAKFGASAQLARLFVILVLAKFFLQTAAFQKFLEASQGRANRLAIVYFHPNRHKVPRSTCPEIILEDSAQDISTEQLSYRQLFYLSAREVEKSRETFTRG
jgi:hypothetical protein